MVLMFILMLKTGYVQAQGSAEKLRVMVLTDIEAEPDDAQSMVRFLTYANQWDIEGLVATTSTHLRKRTAPESIHKILKAYQKVQPNLLLHEKGYPSYEELSAKVKKSIPEYGMQGVGEGKDTEGSDWLVKSLEKNDERSLWVLIWGGSNCLAQALWKIKSTKAAEQAEKLYRKLRVYAISDQDDAAPWLRKNFPSVFYIVTPGYTYGLASWRGINTKYDGTNQAVISDEWLAEHIQQGHGALGVMYPDVAYGMEGDSPTFLYLIPNGLNTPEHPNYGGWGGRYEFYTPPLEKDTLMNFPNIPQIEPESRPIWTNAVDSVVSSVDKKGYKSNFATVWRWREAFQNDFAARMDWCKKPFKEVNHPPVPKLAHADNFTVKSGAEFQLNADGSYDPDDDSVSYLWFQYKEAGSFKGTVHLNPAFASPKIYNITLLAPVVTKPETIHFILKLTDKGKPALTRYKRVIITVVP